MGRQIDEGQARQVVFVIQPVYDSDATSDMAVVAANQAERAYFASLLDAGEAPLAGVTVARSIQYAGATSARSYLVGLLDTSAE